MPNILALDTSTEACSVSLQLGAEVETCWELIPRQHNQRLFGMLAEVLAGRTVAELDLELLAYAQGPGSFTGLRIAASAIQGLAYSGQIPVAGISTLACMAQGALRRGLVGEADHVLVLLDARINEIYGGVYEYCDGLARPIAADLVCAPADFDEALLPADTSIVAIGSGLCHSELLPETVRSRIERSEPEFWPDSVDLLPLAAALSSQGYASTAADVQPVYLRNEISWKKLSEQG